MRSHRISTDEWAIPPTVVGPVAEERRPVLLWVHTGTATVEASGVKYQVASGEAIWIPPGVRHHMRSDAGSVVIPVAPTPEELTETLRSVRVVSIPRGWENWLIHQSVDREHIGRHVHDALAGTRILIDLVGGSPHGFASHRGGGEALPMPRSREALSVARMLLRDPGLPWSVKCLAQWEKVGIKTLQRQFRRETEMTISQWRTRARILAATQHLADGQSVGWTGTRVGFTTAAGFTKAFRRHTGHTPRDHALHSRGKVRRVQESRVQGSRNPDVDPAAALAAGVTTTPPTITVRRAWTRINPGHFLLWVFRGEVTVRIGTRELRLTRGEAVWVPAHVPNTIEYTADSIAIPVGDSYVPVPLDVDGLTVLSFPPEAEKFLLYTSIIQYTLIRSDTQQSSFAEDLFRAQFLAGQAVNRPHRPAGRVETVTEAVRRNPADSRTLEDWARLLRTTPRALGTEFRDQTGETLPRWRAQWRMTVARHLLHMGEAPGAVARYLGYSGSAAFANAFTVAHGMSPREYQSREVAEPA